MSLNKNCENVITVRKQRLFLLANAFGILKIVHTDALPNLDLYTIQIIKS